MSALGIGLAEVTARREIGVYALYAADTPKSLQPRFAEMARDATQELVAQGLEEQRLHVEESLELRYVGLNETISISRPADGDYRAAYIAAFNQRFGYIADEGEIEIVTASFCPGRSPRAPFGKPISRCSIVRFKTS